MLSQGVDSYLVSRLGSPRHSGGLEVKFDCPCPECLNSRSQGKNDPKLYVNFSKGVFYCVRSGWGGPIDKLYSSVGLVYENPIAIPPDFSSILEGDSKAIEDGMAEVELPECAEFSPYSDAMIWLRSRLIDVPEEELQSLISSGIIRRGAGRYWNRVFFVDMYQEKPRYWTARAYMGDMSRKYLNPKNVPRTNVLGNQEYVSEEYRDEIIVCEGAISAIVAGRNSVWTYGRCVTHEQIALLDSILCSRYLLVSEPDFRARQNTIALARSLANIHRDVYIVDMPVVKYANETVYHDPASLGRTTFKKLAEENSVKFSWGSEVERRLAVC